MRKLRQKLPWLLAALLCLMVTVAWHLEQAFEHPALATLGTPTSVTGDRPIEPIPNLLPELNSQKVALGNQLYQDPQFSKDNKVSCASCHALDKGGTDRRVRSVGINGKVGFINAPTILNSSLHFKQFWDGRAESLEAQIDGPVHNDLEMGSSWPEIIGKLKQSSDYRAQFNQLYDDGITDTNIKNAIATYERSLNTPNSRFDRYLNGDKTALNAEEQEGYRLFQGNGCVACHQGVLLGGNLFQKFGVFGDYFQDRGNITQADYGRFNVTKKEEDRFVFKVPSLRNVELTAPYFHDGQAETLDEAVRVMMRYQLGREASSEDINLIIKFLTTLTGQQQGVS
jgi:cytochrome c peroxidase